MSLVKDIKPSLQDTKTYDLDIPEIIIFDLAEHENQINQNSNKELFVFLTVKYQTPAYNDLFLGYCKVTIYKPQQIGSINTWVSSLNN